MLTQPRHMVVSFSSRGEGNVFRSSRCRDYLNGGKFDLLQLLAGT
jgi:hypothetical protein